MVLRAQGLDLLWIGPSLAEKFTSFSKEFLESCRRNNFYESSGLVCGIPESMRNASRFQNIVAWVREEDRVTDPCSELALYHIGILVSIMVDVRRDKSPWLQRVLDYRESMAGLFACNLELDTNSADGNKFALARLNPEAVMPLSRIMLLHETANNLA